MECAAVVIKLPDVSRCIYQQRMAGICRNTWSLNWVPERLLTRFSSAMFFELKPCCRLKTCQRLLSNDTGLIWIVFHEDSQQRFATVALGRTAGCCSFIDGAGWHLNLQSRVLENWVSSVCSCPSGSYCNLERIGLPLGSIMVGMPVSNKWVKQLRYVVTQLSMDGHLQQSLTQYRPQAYCSALETESTAPEALTVAAWICLCAETCRNHNWH